MKRRFTYFPDAPLPGSGSSKPAPSKTVRMPKLPNKDTDFGAVATIVAGRWSANPQITLIWADSKTFEAKAAAYNEALGGRKSAGGKRPFQTQALAGVDAEIDKGIARAKIYLQDKWDEKDAAFAQYARYGIVKRGDVYELPRDRQQRLAALDMVLEAIAQDGFEKKPFGSDFWRDVSGRYRAALSEAGTTDGAVSTGVSNKNLLKAELREMMEALQFVIRGNYPKTWEAIYREWGWQKEDY